LTGVTHPTSHPQALEDSRRRRRATDRAGLAVVTVRTVRGTHAGEAVTLHDTGGALALGGTDHVDLGTGLEHVGGDLLAERELGGVLGADLGHVAARRHAGLLEVALERLGDLARVDLTGRELHGRVAVGVRGADLRHHVRAHGDDGHRHEATLLVPELRDAVLGAEHRDQVLLWVGRDVLRPQSLISMFTSAGRSSRMSESTAFGVGSMMSMSRLCVRISKCSRLSLYLCGERMTQKTFFSVGSGTGPTTVAPALNRKSTRLNSSHVKISY